MFNYNPTLCYDYDLTHQWRRPQVYAINEIMTEVRRRMRERGLAETRLPMQGPGSPTTAAARSFGAALHCASHASLAPAAPRSPPAAPAAPGLTMRPPASAASPFRPAQPPPSDSTAAAGGGRLSGLRLADATCLPLLSPPSAAAAALPASSPLRVSASLRVLAASPVRVPRASVAPTARLCATPSLAVLRAAAGGGARLWPPTVVARAGINAN